MVLIYGIPPEFRGGVFRLINNANLARGHARKGTEVNGSHHGVWPYIHIPTYTRFGEGGGQLDRG